MMDLFNDPITFAENLVDPPCKSWFLVNVVSNCVFSNFDGIGFLDIGEGYPRRGTINPINFEIPAVGCNAALGGARREIEESGNGHDHQSGHRGSP